jgi:hypothetical protein
VNSRNKLSLAGVSLLALNLTACELVKGIFKAGVWVGVLGVFVVVVLGALVAGLFRK